MKYFLIVVKCVFIVVFIAIFVIVQSTYKEYYGNIRLQEINVNINDSTYIGLVDKNDILKRLSRFAIHKNTTLIKNISLSAIENSLAGDEYINSVEVYSDVSGRLNIDVKQFVPIMRIIDKDGMSYFIDKNYKVVKYRNFMNLSLPIVSQGDDVIPISTLRNKSKAGEIDEKRIKIYNRIDNLECFINEIQDDDLWRTLISQIYLNSRGDVELIPRIGTHTITFCEIDSLAKYDKYFSKLLKFYRDQTNNGLWVEYKNINLKYEGQVVCKK